MGIEYTSLILRVKFHLSFSLILKMFFFSFSFSSSTKYLGLWEVLLIVMRFLVQELGGNGALKSVGIDAVILFFNSRNVLDHI